MPETGTNETTMKIGWLKQMISDKVAGKYPNLTAVCFFNYFKFGSTHGGDTERLVDFRMVGGDANVETQFRQIVGNVSAYQGGYSGSAQLSSSVPALAVLVGVMAALAVHSWTLVWL